MGIKAAFEQGGGFDKVSDVDIKLNQINHRATIETNKFGTVASAATSIEFVRLFADFAEPNRVFINRPFLYYVRDTEEKTILFAGKYFNPNADPQNNE